VSNATTSATFNGSVDSLHAPLRTQYLVPPIAFNAITVFKGHLVFVNNGFIYYTEPYAFELFDIRYSFIPMHEPVHILAAVDAGLFIGTETKHYFARGSDISNFSSIDVVASYGAVPGKVVYAEASQLDPEFSVDRAAMWTTKHGVVVGTNNGGFFNITEKRAAFTASVKRAAQFVRKVDEQNHFVSVVQS